MAEFIQFPNYFGDNLSNLAGGIAQGQKSVQDMRMLAAQPQAQEDIYKQFITGAPNFAQVAGSLAKMGNYGAGVDMLKANANQGNENLSASMRTAQAIYNTKVNIQSNANEALKLNPASQDAATAVTMANADVAKAKRNYELAYNAWAEASKLPPIEVYGDIIPSGNKGGVVPAGDEVTPPTAELTPEQIKNAEDAKELTRQKSEANKISSNNSTYKNLKEVETALNTANVTDSEVRAGVMKSYNDYLSMTGEQKRLADEATARAQDISKAEADKLERIIKSAGFRDIYDGKSAYNSVMDTVKAEASDLENFTDADANAMSKNVSRIWGAQARAGDREAKVKEENVARDLLAKWVGLNRGATIEEKKAYLDAVKTELTTWWNEYNQNYKAAFGDADMTPALKNKLTKMYNESGVSSPSWSYGSGSSSTNTDVKVGDRITKNGKTYAVQSIVEGKPRFVEVGK